MVIGQYLLYIQHDYTSERLQHFTSRRLFELIYLIQGSQCTVDVTEDNVTDDIKVCDLKL